jgi:nucleoside-diphosphate-sugar epimerase
LKGLAPDVVLDMIPLGEEDTGAVVRVFAGVAGRIVAISSQDVFRAYGLLHGTEIGPPEEMPLTEDAALRERFFPYRDAATGTDDPRYDYEKILVERAIMGNSDLPGTVLRLPAVYGPRDPQHRLFPYLKRMGDKRPGIILDEVLARWRWSSIYVENAASAIILAVTDDRAGGRVYNIVEPEAMSEAEWIRQIGFAAGWSGEVVIVPEDHLPTHLQPEMGRPPTLRGRQYPHPARVGISGARAAF